MGRTVACYGCGVRFRRPGNQSGPKFLCKKCRRGRSWRKTRAIVRDERRRS